MIPIDVPKKWIAASFCALWFCASLAAQAEEASSDKTWTERLGLPLPIAQQDFAEVCGANFARWLFAEEAEAKALLADVRFREDRFIAERITDWIVEPRDVLSNCATTAFFVIDSKYQGPVADVMKAVIRKKQAWLARSHFYQNDRVYNKSKQKYLANAADTRDRVLMRKIAQMFSEQIAIYVDGLEEEREISARKIYAWLKNAEITGVSDAYIGLFFIYYYGVGAERNVKLAEEYRTMWQKWKNGDTK